MKLNGGMPKRCGKSPKRGVKYVSVEVGGVLLDAICVLWLIDGNIGHSVTMYALLVVHFNEVGRGRCFTLMSVDPMFGLLSLVER